MKMPFAVDYFVDASQIGPDDIRWVPEARTLIVDAPDVSVGTPNVIPPPSTAGRPPLDTGSMLRYLANTLII